MAFAGILCQYDTDLQGAVLHVAEPRLAIVKLILHAVRGALRVHSAWRSVASEALRAQSLSDADGSRRPPGKISLSVEKADLRSGRRSRRMVAQLLLDLQFLPLSRPRPRPNVRASRLRWKNWRLKIDRNDKTPGSPREGMDAVLRPGLGGFSFLHWTRLQ